MAYALLTRPSDEPPSATPLLEQPAATIGPLVKRNPKKSGSHQKFRTWLPKKKIFPPFS